MTNAQLSGESPAGPSAGPGRPQWTTVHVLPSAAEEAGASANPVGARLAGLAGLRPGDRVLDVGCGRGAVLFAALAEVGPRGAVTGVDPVPGTVRATGATAAGRGLRNVRVELGDVRALDFPDASFDVALSSAALVATPDPAAALASLHRVLAPGGRLGFTAFGADSPGWDRPGAALGAFLPPWAAGLRPGGAARRNALGGSPEEAAELLLRCGFGEVRSEQHDAVSHYPDAHSWWREQRTGDWRAALEAVPAEQLDRARTAALAELARLAGPDGGLTKRTAVRYTTALRR
ncbi:class I SAM-dependent methyltransferase [Kitasatospora sp. NPDC006697]|uniref:class I SAM-dependent methyltransferase n=1 Tax=Kitasatospora sp. NPDC006697 TaxID=3364020 RepID=UPI0036B354BE